MMSKSKGKAAAMMSVRLFSAAGSTSVRMSLKALTLITAAGLMLSGKASAAPDAAPDAGSVVGELSVAFLGDQGVGSDARAVLDLVASKDIDLLVLLGDFGYAENAAADWIRMMEEAVPASVAVVGVVGNHENFEWPAYRDWLVQRAAQSPDLTCVGNLGVKAHCSFRGLSVVQVAPGIIGVPGVLSADSYPEFIEQSLEDDPNRWRICSWHMNQRAMQIGGKDDATGWGVYEACRRSGGIVATAHEHSYSRTRLLDNFESQSIVNRDDHLEIAEGQTFAFVSGLGGNSIRPQRLDGDWWAAVWSSTQGASDGALFCRFGGSEGECHFEDVAGAVPDRFTLETRVDGPDAGPEPACGSPDIDPAVDAGVHVWQDCDDGVWTYFLTGEPAQGAIRADGLISSSLGFLNVASQTLEASDTLATPNSTLTTFSLTTGSPWSDRFEFSAPPNDQLCIGLTRISGGEQLYIGPDRTPVGAGPVNPETLQGCRYANGADCYRPAYDPAAERGLVSWVDCTGVVHLVVMGGQNFARFGGSVSIGTRFSEVVESRFESGDSLVQTSDSRVTFEMASGGGAHDELMLTPVDGATVCVELSVRSSGTSVTAGGERTPVSASSFDPQTGEACTPSD